MAIKVQMVRIVMVGRMKVKMVAHHTQKFWSEIKPLNYSPLEDNPFQL